MQVTGTSVNALGLRNWLWPQWMNISLFINLNNGGRRILPDTLGSKVEPGLHGVGGVKKIDIVAGDGS